MSIVCAICGTTYFPWHRWWEDTCQECWQYNFAASQELRMHEENASLTPREWAALELLQRVQARREDA